MKPWIRYVYDTITSIKPDFMTDVFIVLNKFHENINFTYKVECNNKVTFTYVLLMRSNKKLGKKTFRKGADTDIIYIRGLLLLFCGRKRR